MRTTTTRQKKESERDRERERERDRERERKRERKRENKNTLPWSQEWHGKGGVVLLKKKESLSFFLSFFLSFLLISAVMRKGMGVSWLGPVASGN
jgi:hypothetical protein